jgi:hypothetical protein
MKEVICTQESEKWKVKDAIERVQRSSLFETMPSVSIFGEANKERMMLPQTWAPSAKLHAL